MDTITKITWKLYRGKGWKKWVSDDRTAWVLQWKHEPGFVHCGLWGSGTGRLEATPEMAMANIEGVYAT